jgi:hypothetical protein
MLRTIVVPLDGTDFAANSLPVGIALATAASASIRVIGRADRRRARVDVLTTSTTTPTVSVSTRLTSRCESTRARQGPTRHGGRGRQGAVPRVARSGAAGSGVDARRRVEGERTGAPFAGRRNAIGEAPAPTSSLGGGANPASLLALAADWAPLHTRLRIVTATTRSCRSLVQGRPIGVVV